MNGRPRSTEWLQPATLLWPRITPTGIAQVARSKIRMGIASYSKRRPGVSMNKDWSPQVGEELHRQDSLRQPLFFCNELRRSSLASNAANHVSGIFEVCNELRIDN